MDYTLRARKRAAFRTPTDLNQPVYGRRGAASNIIPVVSRRIRVLSALISGKYWTFWLHFFRVASAAYLNLDEELKIPVAVPRFRPWPPQFLPMQPLCSRAGAPVLIRMRHRLKSGQKLTVIAAGQGSPKASARCGPMVKPKAEPARRQLTVSGVAEQRREEDDDEGCPRRVHRQ